MACSANSVARPDGDFSQGESTSAVCYCWFVWEKGFKGNPVIKWFNYCDEWIVVKNENGEDYLLHFVYSGL